MCIFVPIPFAAVYALFYHTYFQIRCNKKYHLIVREILFKLKIFFSVYYVLMVTVYYIFTDIYFFDKFFSAFLKWQPFFDWNIQQEALLKIPIISKNKQNYTDLRNMWQLLRYKVGTEV